MTSPNDEHYIRIAIEVAGRAVEHGNHPFGAILVHGRQILLKAENSVITDQDITRHAELNLVSQASRKYGVDVLQECTLYTSTEPCLMCAGAIYWAGIPRVVYGCSAARLAHIAGKEIAITIEEVYARATNPAQVSGPILQELAAEQHQAYWNT